MPYTTDQLAAVQDAIARGELRVTYGNRSVEYRSMEDLIAAEAHILESLATSATSRPKQIIGVARKGFC